MTAPLRAGREPAGESPPARVGLDRLGGCETVETGEPRSIDERSEPRRGRGDLFGKVSHSDKQATDKVDEWRRRVPIETLGHRGRNGDRGADKRIAVESIRFRHDADTAPSCRGG